MDLFTHAHEERMMHDTPLATRMRPRTLDEFIGQGDILGSGKLLRRAILFVDELRRWNQS